MKIKTFLLSDIVKIDYGNKFDLQKMTFDMPTVNFVSRTALNNGVSAKVDLVSDKLPYNEGCLTIALGGSIGATFYQNKPFYTGQNVAVLQFKENVSVLSKLYLCQIIKFEVKNKFRAFGRELNRHIKTDFTVSLPSNHIGAPDWDYMDRYMQTMHYKKIKSNNYQDDFRINLSNWKEFKIGELFSLFNGIKYPSYDREFGILPLVSTTASNNGISDYINDRPEKYNNILTVAYSGSVGATFYQGKEVFVGETVFALVPKFKMNKYIAMFICTIMNFHNFKYTYGRKIIGTRYIDDVIKLPALSNEPDWQFMENYIKSLPYGDRI